jgi:pimeloyl-ACP methyl ester carboxylesterase
MRYVSKKEVSIESGGVMLFGILSVPLKARGLIIFAHGSGSSRNSPRNLFVSDILNSDGFATLLVDLLTVKEDETDSSRFDISLLTDRLFDIATYYLEETDNKFRNIGFFGASTGSASALRAAARLKSHIFAVVSRGGRPDLALNELAMVKAPTLLIVGSNDTHVLELNKRAFMLLHCEKSMEIVPGATHLFEEPGTLQRVADLASAWFTSVLDNLEGVYDIQKSA